ncbi:PEP-CTERM sorting domain-containing protein [Paucibacter sp. M5-1]|uniref:PEP-CTERM sorting domain-containing protein n=1 Tax=Paucibacter sp. M5-1 TaxID=3015998 RepID=UPI0022B8AC55|nr:PEP-CTERM sorting domain-containing protein [Paucibacter sp. M5-1]MCZ7884315.1 PEP-CTERM sorting domain-containing protein [Paucibacter sp. M5-1]
MKNLLLAALVLAATVPAYGLEGATAYSFIGINGGMTSRSSDFGLNTIAGVGNVSTLIGTDSQGTPFISFAASTSNARVAEPFAEASLRYHWTVVAKDGAVADAEVPVTVSYLGNWAYEYWMLPYIKDRYNLTPGFVQIAMMANFYTTTKGNAVDQRTAGLQMGGYNWGVEHVAPPAINQTRLDYTASGTAKFEDSFEILAKPNAQNRISLQVTTNERYYNNNTFHHQYAEVSWSVAGYIDPIITVAPEFADRYTVQVSVMPVVPEPETYGLMLLGLAVLAAARRGRNGTAVPRMPIPSAPQVLTAG